MLIEGLAVTVRVSPPDACGKKQSNQVNELEIDFFFFKSVFR